MSDNRFVFQGLDELKRQLRALPEDLTGEAGHIVQAAANGAGVAVRAGYGQHRHSGNLADHVTVTHEQSGLAASATVRATARHAHLFEYGTQARHTALGWNRGAMPPGNVFVPAILRARARMYQELKDVVRRAGLIVRGDA